MHRAYIMKVAEHREFNIYFARSPDLWQHPAVDIYFTRSPDMAASCSERAGSFAWSIFSGENTDRSHHAESSSS